MEPTTSASATGQTPRLPDDPRPPPCGTCLLVLTGPMLGETYSLPETPVVLGRDPEAHIRLEAPDVSREHARIEREGGRWMLVDLDSTNGTRINGRPVRQATLHDGDKIRVGASVVVRFTCLDRLEQDFQRRMFEYAVRDELTGAYNRRHMLDRLRAEVAFAARHGKPLALLLADIDHFKRVNDTLGHAAGDAALAAIARAIGRTVRAEDLVARWGGEEFAVLCRGIDEAGAGVLAERIRGVVAALVPFGASGPGSVRLTVSVGIAGLAGEVRRVADPCEIDRRIDLLIEQTDRALYAAKAGGRNRACAVSAARAETPAAAGASSPPAGTAS